jgi:hypothetical protein
MEISPKTNVDPVVRTTPGQTPVRESRAAREAVSFAGTEALNSALAGVPEVRLQVVERAKELANDASYPPPEIIKRIANLLAMDSEPEAE